MKLGITTYYINRYGTKDGARRMRSHGYEYLDYQKFADVESEFFNLSEKDFEAEIKEDRKIIESEGVFVHQAHGPWTYPTQDSTPEERKLRFEYMSKAIRGTAYLGGKTMVIHPIMPFGAKSPENPEEMKKINFEFFSALCDVAREYGIIISYENMPFVDSPIHTARDVADLARKINNDYFKVCLDTGHSIRCGESLGDAVRYIGKDLLYAMHVHDNMGDHDKHMLPGEGIGDWDSFRKALLEINFDGVFSFETSPKLREGETEDNLELKELALAEFGRKMINTGL